MGGVNFSEPMGMALLVLPFAALLIVIVLSLRAISRRRRAATLLTPTTGRYGAPSSDEPAAAPATAAPSLQHVTGERLARAITDAETAGQKQVLAGLLLQQAQEFLAKGQTAEASNVLTRCIRNAAQSNQRTTHAQARLELGEIARAGGDLTTACEHWQIARTLLLELQKMPEFDVVDRRMRQNGCPTDWVLNDF